MDHQVLIESFSEFKEVKNIDRATMMSILEDVIKATLRKKFGTSDNFDVIINIDKGDLEIYRNRMIVDDGMVEDDATQIAYSEAIKIEPDFEVGEELTESVRLGDFGRRAVLALASESGFAYYRAGERWYLQEV
jgi:N utilization substance protein A